MPRFSANLSYLFKEYNFLDRLNVARDNGFKGVECQFPYTENLKKLEKVVLLNKLDFVQINAPAGDFLNGERGIAGIPDRSDEFRKSIMDAIMFAENLGCRRIHIMAGIKPNDLSRQAFIGVLIENLKIAGDLCANKDIKILIEPINSLAIPCYGIQNLKEAKEIILEAKIENLYLQYDLYHGCMNQENLLTSITDNIDIIAHMQIAGVPERREPNTGSVDFYPVFKQIDDLGYDHWVGCEYTPATSTLAGLNWLQF